LPIILHTSRQELSQVLSKLIFEKDELHPSRQRMVLFAACATICAMPTADKSNRSAAGTLHPHRTDGQTMTAYTALNFLTSLD